MLKRKATTFIKNWLDTKDKKCLVVQGARQTGKTYIIERFAEENFEELLEINFKQMPSAMDIFAGDLTVDNMIMAMRFRFPEKKIVPGKTLIFLDEIQECQEAITSLKFWATDNRYDVITSGSLLGIDYKRASSYPVGYVDYLRMYGMDFEEFLWGIGISEEMIGNLCGYLHLKTVIPEAIHSQMMNYYRQYVATGGMPEVVQKYIDTILQADPQIDTLVLACTHYPLFKRTIGREVGENVKLVNPAYETAKSLKLLLAENNLLNTLGIEDEEPTYDYYVSDGMEKFISFADDVLSCHVNSAEVVDIEAY